MQPLSGVKVSRRGRRPLTPIADQRLEIVKLSSAGTRAVTKQEETCLICEEADGTLLHCNGPCLRVFHAKCIGLSVAPASKTFTCDECLTGMIVIQSSRLLVNFLTAVSSYLQFSHLWKGMWVLTCDMQWFLVGRFQR